MNTLTLIICSQKKTKNLSGKKKIQADLVRPSGRRFLLPPNRRQAMAFLMSADPKMDGAMDLAILS